MLRHPCRVSSIRSRNQLCEETELSSQGNSDVCWNFTQSRRAAEALHIIRGSPLGSTDIPLCFRSFIIREICSFYGAEYSVRYGVVWEVCTKFLEETTAVIFVMLAFTCHPEGGDSSQPPPLLPCLITRTTISLQNILRNHPVEFL
jgi:hypothetical protein